MNRIIRQTPKFATLLLSLLMLAACSGGGGGSSQQPPPPQPSFSYTISGSAIKGKIVSATVSVLDANGNAAGTTTTTDSDGHFTLAFTTNTELALPLQVVVGGANARSVCDIQPVCEIGLDASGASLTVGFGDLYDLPDDFRLRAVVTALDSPAADTFDTTTWISPLSEFVTARALAMGSGTTLTDSDVTTANERVLSILTDVFPTLEIPAGLDIATVPLLDLTDLAGSSVDAFNNLSIAATTISAATLYFVEGASGSRGDIAQVIQDFSDQINGNTDGASPLLDSHDRAVLANEAIEALDEVLAEVDTGGLTTPEDFSRDGLLAIRDDGAAILPAITDIWTNISPRQSTDNVRSDATGRADMIILTDTGEATVSLVTSGIDAAAAHLHQGYAGSNGPILVGLERDPGNENRWQFPAGTVLEPDMVAAIMKGETYFNVHTAAYPAGEIRGQVLPANIQLFLATPSGLEQVPQPVDSDGFARAAVTLDTDTNVAQVHFRTTSDLAAAHIHQEIAGRNGPVVIPMQQDMLSMDHWSADDVAFTQELLDALSSAQLYFNLHTTANPNGELRGQVVPDGYRVRIFTLDSSQEVSTTPVDSTATGAGALTVNMATGVFSLHVNTTDLTNAQLAHIHEAPFGENGGIVFDLTQDMLDPGHWSAADQTFTTDQLLTFIDNGFYANVHTAQYDNGEIRGQIVDASLDADGDGVPDFFDAFPEDASESVDSDGDGVGDNADQCPNDPSGSIDSNGDGICDTPSEIQDTDGDGVVDAEDAFPNDPTETADTDGDGVGDNADAFPMDASETVDTDADGVGNNADNCPTTANPNQEDTDGDGIGDACEAGPTYSEVQAIFSSRCIQCHNATNFAGGLNLSSGVSYNNLVNVPSGELPNVDYVEPGNPDNSYLIWKLEGRQGISGSRMPLGGQALSTSQIQLVADWIAAGANP